MSPAWIAVIFTFLAACAAWGIRSAFRTGVAGDGLYRFDRDESPIGFAVLIAGKLLVIGFAAAEILHALKLCGDPVVMLRALVVSAI
jgi:hypothetical protein